MGGVRVRVSGVRVTFMVSIGVPVGVGVWAG